MREGKCKGPHCALEDNKIMDVLMVPLNLQLPFMFSVILSYLSLPYLA